MAWIRCIVLSVPSNSYKGPSGREYLFHKGGKTRIDNKEDIDYFLKTGKGEYFEEVSVKGKAKKAAKKVKEVVTGKTPETKPSADEEKPKVHTEEEFFAMNRDEQAELIRKLGGANMRVPHLENDRVKLLLDIQG